MDAQLIATHHRPALVVALLALAVSLVACQGGVDVAVTGIPADAWVSVDSLSQDIAVTAPVIYRHRGIGSAKVFGLAAAPSYTATARDVSGCIKATASAEYDGEDEVLINLRPVEGCGNVSAPPAPESKVTTLHGGSTIIRVSPSVVSATTAVRRS